MKTCHHCKQQGILKVICMGFPMRLCRECGTVSGMFSWVAMVVPPVEDEDGEPVFAFMSYKGNYLSALWVWLRS